MNSSSSLINIGGVGSCVLSQVLRNLNYPCYPYDWNATYASLATKSILNLSPLFIFEKIYYTSPPLFVNKSIRNNDNTAWDIHSFKNSFETDVEKISEMYNRRLIRLTEKLNSGDNKILIRMMHTQDSFHPEINGNKEKDSVEIWINFYTILKLKYKNIKIILISEEDNEIFYRNIEDGILLVNDKEIFNNKNGKLFNFLKDVIYENI
jgi:hypothetical protein